MTDWQDVDAECVKCQGLSFRIWWVIDRENPGAGLHGDIKVRCLGCQEISYLKAPSPETIRWNRK